MDSPEEDIRHLIATRLGLSRSTINDHLNYANCLSDEIIEYLIQNKANKKFFDNSRKEKSKLLRSLESQRLSGEEKTRRISDFMRDLYEGTGGEGRLRASGQPHTPVSNGPVEQQANNSHLTDPEGTAPGAANDGDEGQGDESEELNELSDDEPSQDQDEEPDIEDCSIDSAVDISELKEEAAEIAVNLNLAIRDACNIDELESCIAQGIADFEEVRRRLHSLQGEIC